MKTLFLSFLFSLTLSSIAISPQADVKNQLCLVNKEWGNQKDVDFDAIHLSAENMNSTDWISLHLELVVSILSQRNTNQLTPAQLVKRTSLLAELKKYASAKTFPQNTFLPYQTPVFIDDLGTHCAVGFLMQQSGYENLAQTINNQQRFAYLKDIKVKGVAAWAVENGFTADELAWIQPGYPPTTVVDDLAGGLNGTVNAIAMMPDNSAVYFGGNFTQSTSGTPCQNIAVWQNGFAGFSWTSIGHVDGEIHALLLADNKLYAAGSFKQVGGISVGRVAYYDLVSGQWNTMGTLDSTVRALAFYKGDLYAGGDFLDLVKKWNGTSWQTINNGLLGGNQVRAFEVWKDELYIGGDLDLATGALRRHVAKYDGTQMLTSGFGTATPINDFEIWEGELYAACDFVSGNDTCALASFDTLNQEWKTVLKPYTLSFLNLEGKSFKSLHSIGNSLYAGGDFAANAGMTGGAGLGVVKRDLSNPNQLICTPILALDKPVHTIVANFNTIYFGGQFQKNVGDTLGQVGSIILDPNSIKEASNTLAEISAFPNPTSNVILFSSAENKIDEVKIFDAKGKLVFQAKGDNKVLKVSVSSSPSGIYMADVYTKAGKSSLKFVKE